MRLKHRDIQRRNQMVGIVAAKMAVWRDVDMMRMRESPGMMLGILLVILVSCPGILSQGEWGSKLTE